MSGKGDLAARAFSSSLDSIRHAICETASLKPEFAVPSSEFDPVRLAARACGRDVALNLERYWMASLFEDCRDFEVLFAERALFSRLAERLVEVGVMNEDERDLLALAGVLLARVSFEPTSTSTTQVPRAWFLDLERLFERAVRRELSRSSGKGVSVTAGTRLSPRIFETEKEFTANPDLVIRKNGTVVAIGDVKYKDWTGSTDASDLYQLLVHASAFRAANAFLVFPSAEFQVRYLAEACTGCRTWIFAINIREFSSDLARLAKNLRVTAGLAE